jgi:hypothetical protein
MVEPDALTPCLKSIWLHLPFYAYTIGFGNIVARMGEPKGEVAIVGEQQRPGGVGIEPPDGMNTQGLEVGR